MVITNKDCTKTTRRTNRELKNKTTNKLQECLKSEIARMVDK